VREFAELKLLKLLCGYKYILLITTCVVVWFELVARKVCPRMGSAWRPLLHHERFEYDFVIDRSDVMRGYVIEAEMMLPGHENCECDLSRHSMKEKWFRGHSAADGSFPVHYSVSDQWAIDIARTGFDAHAMSGKKLHKFIVTGSTICYGYMPRAAESIS